MQQLRDRRIQQPEQRHGLHRLDCLPGRAVREPRRQRHAKPALRGLSAGQVQQRQQRARVQRLDVLCSGAARCAGWQRDAGSLVRWVRQRTLHAQQQRHYVRAMAVVPVRHLRQQRTVGHRGSRLHDVQCRHVLGAGESVSMPSAGRVCGRYGADRSWQRDRSGNMQSMLHGDALRRRQRACGRLRVWHVGSRCELRHCLRSAHDVHGGEPRDGRRDRDDGSHLRHLRRRLQRSGQCAHVYRSYGVSREDADRGNRHRRCSVHCGAWYRGG